MLVTSTQGRDKSIHTFNLRLSHRTRNNPVIIMLIYHPFSFITVEHKRTCVDTYMHEATRQYDERINLYLNFFFLFQFSKLCEVYIIYEKSIRAWNFDGMFI